MKKLLLLSAILFFAFLGLFAIRAEAAQLNISFSSTDGSDGSVLLDDDYRSTEHFDGGTALTIQTPEPIDSLYIKWDTIPSAWTLEDGGSTIACGESGFLHEFVQLSGTSASATIRIPSEGATIADIFAFSGGELPAFVQKWNPSWDKADILFISTHSDDEVLFFGGLIPIYTNGNRARVQVAYFSDFFLSESYRNHELLDGIWTMGVDHYPQLGKFYDNYSETLEEAEEQFDHEESLEYITETIRRFKPQVVVTHDINGEYGHGGHMYVSKLVREAVDGVSGNASRYPDSAGRYGAWDVLKTYLHLYPENPIESDTRAPLEDFGGKNALQVAKEAYLKHGSQQWMWFYVDDGYDEAGNPNGYEYSCARYGLYRTAVGPDTGGKDILENITPYDKQEKTADPDPEPVTSPDPGEKKGGGKVWLVIVIIVILLILAFVIILLIMRAKEKKRQAERQRRARAGRAAENRQRRKGQASSDEGYRQSRTPENRHYKERQKSVGGTSGERQNSANRTSGEQRRSANGRYREEQIPERKRRNPEGRSSGPDGRGRPGNRRY